MTDLDRVVVVTTHRGHGEDTRVWGIFADMGTAVAAVKAELGADVYSSQAWTMLRRGDELFGQLMWRDVRQSPVSHRAAVDNRGDEVLVTCPTCGVIDRCLPSPTGMISANMRADEHALAHGDLDGT